MKNKNRFLAVCIACVLVLSLTWTVAYALELRASPVFESGYVMTGRDLFTEFGASAHKICKEIYVSSCTLQEMDSNGNVIASTSLTPPSDVAKDMSNFTAWATYSGTSGKRYRIKAVFTADGYTITRYSKIVTYQ